MQKDFLKSMLILCKEENLHTAIDTAGNISWETFEEILPYTNIILYDIKIFDSQKHKEITGAGNNQILKNLRNLANYNTEIYIRIPIIPTVNDNTDSIIEIADFISGLNNKNIKSTELLPFHRLGEWKYRSIGIDYKAKNFNPPSKELISGLNKILKNF